jgi:hypothetical protein
MRVFMPVLAVAVASSFATSALADRTAADACAAKLPANAKLIYAASISEVTPATDLRELLRTKTRSLVIGGKVGRSDAMGAAEAAGACLREAK